MRGSALKLVLCASAFALAACNDSGAPVAPSSRTLQAAKNPRFDSYIVVLKRGSPSIASVRSGARLSSVRAKVSSRADNAVVRQTVPSIHALVVEGVTTASDVSGDDVQDVIPNYEHDLIDPVPFGLEMVEAADEGVAPTGTNQASAFFFANNTQWGYKRVSANRAWVPSRGGAGAKVCIVDSGIDPGHSAFVGKTITSASFLVNASGQVISSAQTDTNGHGSHVAGTISTNGVGGASVVPDATLMTAKVFNGAGGGATAAVTINAVAWCVDNGADVINMSLGFTGGIPTTPGNQPFITAYEAGLDYATTNGVLIVASAGNDGATLPVAGRIFLPAEAPGVTSVAATAPTVNLTPYGLNAIWSAPGAAFDGIASYSNRGPVPSVDVSAPGGDLFSGWPVQSLIISVCSRQFRSGTVFPCAGGTSFLYNGGTSMASPHVAGVAALIRARWPSSLRSPALRNKIESCLYRTVDNIGSTAIFGRGRVNAYKAATMPC